MEVKLNARNTSPRPAKTSADVKTRTRREKIVKTRKNSETRRYAVDPTESALSKIEGLLFAKVRSGTDKRLRSPSD